MNMRRGLVLVGVVALVGLLVALREDIYEALWLIGGVDLRLLLLVFPLKLCVHIAKTGFYHSMFAHFGYRIPAWRLFSLNWAIFFLDTALPSVGLSSVAMLGHIMRGYGVPGGKTTLIHFSRYVIVFLSYIFILVVGLIALYAGGELGEVTLWLVSLVGLSIMAFSGFIIYALYREKVFNWLVRWVQTGVDWASKKLRSGQELIGADRIERLLREFYSGFHQVMRGRIYRKQPFIWVALATMFELLILYTVFLSLGYAVNPGIVIITFAMASASGIISLIPGDFGITEAVMIAVLTAAGVPLAVGVSATLLYRVTTKLFLLPVGFFFYTRSVGRERHAADA